MMVTQRAVARGLARSASTCRRARTSAATDSARLSSTDAKPGPRRRAPRIRFAAIRSPVASSRSSANARSAVSVDQRARSRDASLFTSGWIASGADRNVAISACSKPTPAVNTPDSERIHSSIASSLRIFPVSSEVDNNTGKPTAAAGNTTTANSQPVTSATTTPSTNPAASSSCERRDGCGSGKRVLRRGAGGRSGVFCRPTNMPIKPMTIRAPPSAGTSGVMRLPSGSPRGNR